MQRARQQLPVSLGANAAPHSEVHRDLAVRLFEEPALPDETSHGASDLDVRPVSVAPRPDLQKAIRERIQARLPGRVRNLMVEVHDDLVILHGQCATFYTKQLAQHAAMGVLQDEHLENAIVVCVAR